MEVQVRSCGADTPVCELCGVRGTRGDPEISLLAAAQQPVC